MSRFRAGDRGSAAYGVECVLDHLISSVYLLGESYMAAREIDYVAQSSRQLGDADDLASALDGSGVTAAERARFEEYLAATRAVLEALRAADLVDTHGVEGDVE